MNSTEIPSLFIKRLVSTVIDDLLGEGETHEREDEDFPKNMYPAGNLGPLSENVSRMDDFRITEYTPSSIGVILPIALGDQGHLDISGSFNVFFPVAPSLDELQKQASKYEVSFPKNETKWAEAFNDPTQKRALEVARVKYRPIFTRHRISFSSALNLGSLLIDGAYHDIPTTPPIETQLNGVAKEAENNDSCLRVNAKGRPPMKITGGNLENQAAFDALIAKYRGKSIPLWKAGLRYRAWRNNAQKSVVMEILLSNLTTSKEAQELSNRGQDINLFNPRLELKAKFESLAPFELAVLRSKNYRINSRVFSSGVNCDTEEIVDRGVVSVRTDILPIFEQKRRIPARIPADIQEYPLGMPTPQDFDADPILHLKKVSEYLHQYLEWWKDSAPSELVKEKRLSPGVEKDILAASDDFEEEVKGFDEGVQLLVDDEKLRLSFKLMNRSFALNPSSKVKAWRAFQIVFIVTNLRNIAKRINQSDDSQIKPVVLWYPTGGGKTEAYLGLALAAAFWDRLRGKLLGITAWTKFPLRLLSIQQLGRIQAAVSFADLVREQAGEIPAEKKGNAFSVGLYAGGNNSSNDLDFPLDASRSTELSFEGKELVKASDQSAVIRKNHKVDRCPMCVYLGHTTPGKIRTSFDPSTPCLLHKCEQCGYQLKLYVSDTEVIRWLPTIVVSTIDKLAELGNEPATKIFFGYAKAMCPKHGYFLYEGSCNVLGCKDQLANIEGSVDPGPSLLIQDEMHFLRENLGAFGSHYETMMLAIMRRARKDLGGRTSGPWNIVGSSATIEGYAEQIRELYCISEADRFPSQGPAKGMDAYSSERDEVQRYIIGFRPQNMSHVDAVMKVLLSFHRMTLQLADPSHALWGQLGGPLSSLGLGERQDLIRFYRTSLAYSLLKTEAGQIHKSLVGQLNPKLQREGVPPFEEHRIPNLTGEVDATGVAEVLHKLERDTSDWVQALTATSIISHGVDIDILNFIVFRGQPHTVSEWIQAMSRVGRKENHPSIVVNVYNPNRERDAAYYTHHRKYIEHAENLIRTVPITRYSPTALRKTVRGLFFNALAYSSEPSFRYYYRDTLKKELPRRLERLKETLRDYYALNVATATSKESRLLEALDAEIGSIEALLNDPNQPSDTKKALRPMTSLRDIDEPVDITPSYNEGAFRRG